MQHGVRSADHQFGVTVNLGTARAAAAAHAGAVVRRLHPDPTYKCRYMHPVWMSRTRALAGSTICTEFVLAIYLARAPARRELEARARLSRPTTGVAFVDMHLMTVCCSGRSPLHAPMTLLLLLLAFALPCIVSLDNGLAQTPWMAWSAWEVFRCTTCEQDPDNCLSERLIKDTADAMVKGGFRDAGYKIVWIDDCWALKERNATDGRLVPDPSRWPHGLKVVADYVHSLDMQLGLCACCIQSCRAVDFDVLAPFSPAGPARSRLVPTC
eukprot:COSAG02_NODE_614_length_19515_cov_6.651937_15_plen_269_part_00